MTFADGRGAMPDAGAAQATLTHIASLAPQDALAALGSSLAGLHDREVERRLKRYGHNVAVHEKRHGFLRSLWDRIWNPIGVLLLLLAGISWVMEDIKAAVMIGLMVVLSALLSAIQEWRSGNAAEKLRAMVHTTATVLRLRRHRPEQHVSRGHPATHPAEAQHEPREIPIDRLVPGDVIHLSAGDMVPADVRILSARDLFVNQSALTGESLPVEKFAHAATGKDALGLANLCFMGTNILSGSAAAVVVNTGRASYFGALAANLTAQRTPTSFDTGVNRFVWLMIRFMLVMAPLVFLINGVTKGDWLEAFLFAVAVAVGLTPEMLPMVITINLAKGALAMSRKKVIVKRLNSIQNFGAMDVLCTDKTGTLTQDRIILKRHVDIHGTDSDHVLELAYMNSYYQSGLRNLLDVTVLKHSGLHANLRLGTDYRKVDEIPFDFTRRRMSVVVEKTGQGHLLICKGAVEEVFGVSRFYEEAGGDIKPIDAGHLEMLRKVTRELNEDGFRVIAIACKWIEATQSVFGVRDESDLILAGYIAFLDPPKDSAGAAIAALRQYGVAVKILTGDNEIITRKVCRDVGIEAGTVVLGTDIDVMNDTELATAAEEATIFAKLAPMQKERVVKALQSRNHVVGFLGDGINDGPALKASDVGVSVDGAVDIARESADIILLEKNLLILKEGVTEGRRVFGNISKYIRMSASSNFGNMFSMLGGSAFLPFLPMAPVQVLLNNLLYDFSQTAIATDTVDDDSLVRPRKWDIGNIARYMLIIGPVSSLFDYATFFALLYVFGAWDNAALFHTGWFVESLLSQTLIVHVIRTGKVPFLQSRASYPLLTMTIVICLIGAWLPYSHFAPAFGFVPLPLAYWAFLSVILASYLTLTQIVKLWLMRRHGIDF